MNPDDIANQQELLAQYRRTLGKVFGHLPIVDRMDRIVQDWKAKLASCSSCLSCRTVKQHRPKKNLALAIYLRQRANLGANYAPPGVPNGIIDLLSERSAEQFAQWL